MSDEEAPKRSGRSSKGRKSSKKPENDDMNLSDEPLGDDSQTQGHESAFHSSAPSVVIEGVDIDQPEHVSSMRKYVAAQLSVFHPPHTERPPPFCFPRSGPKPLFLPCIAEFLIQNSTKWRLNHVKNLILLVVWFFYIAGWPGRQRSLFAFSLKRFVPQFQRVLFTFCRLFYREISYIIC